MPNISSIPNGEKRFIHDGTPVIFDRKTGNAWEYDSRTGELGMVHTELIGMPGGQTEKSVLMPAASGGSGAPTPTPTATPSKPTFSDLAMPEKKPGKAKIVLPRKKKHKEMSIMEMESDAENPYSNMFTP